MEALLQLLQGQPQVLGIFQIVLDLCLIFLLAFFLIKRSRSLKGVENLAASLENIIAETKNIAEEFDTNLRERQQLIQQLLGNLDQRLQDALAACRKMESLKSTPAPPPPSPPQPACMAPPRQSEHQAILRLAQKGLTPEAIARRLKKPIGEVELVLNLQRLSAE